MIPDSYFDRFTTKKYRSQNPLQRALIRRFVERLHSLVLRSMPIESVLEVGCGEGFLSGYLSEKLTHVTFTGVDLDAGDIAKLKEKFPRIDAHEGSAYDLGFLGEQTFDLVICAEVLEHLETPDVALEQIASRTKKRALLTVPNEPLFMAANFLRGKNITRLGNDIEHINHYNPRSFRRLLEPRFEVLEVTTSFPWLLTLNAPR
ncbi:MAG TPA: class I SAM-dependent methyltransferase [Polyangiaceae bacterium]|nr:class I SAM-dependent methyltransferase [Polyangiaceae bacterium]